MIKIENLSFSYRNKQIFENLNLNIEKLYTEIIKVLNRDIRGRQENLSPLFIIGGMYDLNTPYFLGRIKLENKDDGFSINTNVLKDTMKLKIGENTIENDTKIGIVKDIFKNEQELENMLPERIYDIQTFFEKLEEKVKEYYK